MKPRYDVLTWDSERQAWTPQKGVRRGPYTLWGLRRALRKLRAIGYACDYSSDGRMGDPSVVVNRTDRRRRRVRAGRGGRDDLTHERTTATNKEEIYDAEIAPLMTQIIAACKAHRIPMLATFHIPTEDDDGLCCTTALLAEDFNPPREFLDALATIRPPERKPLMVTTRDATGNVVRMDAIL